MSKFKLILIVSFLLLLFGGCSRYPTVFPDEIDVNIQDQTTRPITLRLNKVIQQNLTLANDVVVSDTNHFLNLTSGHGLVAGDNIILLQENGEPQFFFGEIISVNINLIEMDTLITYPFNSSITSITQFDPNLNKDGSVTPYIAELCNPFTVPIDINRFILAITDGDAMDSGRFGGLNALIYGISLRKKTSEGHYLHYWNAKTNAQLKGIGFDLDYDSKAPAGIYGMFFRLTYNGQDKHGVTIRLEQGQCIELPILDDLTGLSTMFWTAEGQFTMGEEELNTN